jgi:inner membrane protein
MSRGLIWIVAALILGVAEAFIPGAFLIWIAVAAGLVGVVDLVFEPGLLAEIVIFAIGAAVAVYIGQKVYGSLERASPPLPLSRAHALIGRQFALATAIANGFGTMTVDDSVWRVAGPDLPAGTTVKVVAVLEGSLVRVEMA